MLRSYLSRDDIDRLVFTLREADEPTIVCFYGPNSDGKIRVARHLTTILPQKVSMCDIDERGNGEVKNKTTFIIVIVHHDKHIIPLRNWAVKRGYNFNYYQFLLK